MYRRLRANREQVFFFILGVLLVIPAFMRSNRAGRRDHLTPEIEMISHPVFSFRLPALPPWRR